MILLNYDLSEARDWPEPYLLSTRIRRIAYPIKRCCLVTKKALSDLSHIVQAHICMLSHIGQTEGDVEMGERTRREEADVTGETSLENLVEKARNEFRRSVQSVFSEADCVDKIMKSIANWEDEM